AGIGKRTLYLHFSGKEDIALCSIDRVVERLREKLWAVAGEGGPPGERIRQMLLARVLFRFDSVRDYYHGLDDLFEALRPAYMARRDKYFHAEAEIFAAVLQEGRQADVFMFEDALRTAHLLLLATNALLPASLSVRELGKRAEVEAKAAGIADLL